MKFQNYSPMHAKSLEEEELADTTQLLQLYIKAFGLELASVRTLSSLAKQTSGALHDARPRGVASPLPW